MGTDNHFDARQLTSTLVEALAHCRPSDIQPLVAGVLTEVDGIEKAVIWLTDFGFENMRALSDREDIPVEGTLSGRAYSEARVLRGASRVVAPLDSLGRVMGVLELEGDIPQPVVEELPQLGVIIADRLLGSQGQSDLIERLRGAGDMSLAAIIQYDLMPIPSYLDHEVEVGGRIEPAYEIAGDGFDYAVNPGEVEFGLFDAVGHGLRATLLTTIALGSYRLQRRRGRSLREVAAGIEEALAAVTHEGEFVTGLVARIDIEHNRLEVWNAGHIPPIRIRDGHAASLDIEPSVPFALGSGDHVGPTEMDFQTGDTIFMVSDGVVEASDSNRSRFGVGPLIEILERNDAQGERMQVICREVLGAVLEHTGANLGDDATILGVRLARR